MTQGIDVSESAVQVPLVAGRTYSLQPVYTGQPVFVATGSVAPAADGDWFRIVGVASVKVSGTQKLFARIGPDLSGLTPAYNRLIYDECF